MKRVKTDGLTVDGKFLADVLRTKTRPAITATLTPLDSVLKHTLGRWV